MMILTLATHEWFCFCLCVYKNHQPSGDKISTIRWTENVCFFTSLTKKFEHIIYFCPLQKTCLLDLHHVRICEHVSTLILFINRSSYSRYVPLMCLNLIIIPTKPKATKLNWPNPGQAKLRQPNYVKHNSVLINGNYGIVSAIFQKNL